VLDSSPSFGGRFEDVPFEDGRSQFSDGTPGPASPDSAAHAPAPRLQARARTSVAPRSCAARRARACPLSRARAYTPTCHPRDAAAQPPPRRVHTSEDAGRLRAGGAQASRGCGGCGVPFRGYHSLFAYVVGFGWIRDALAGPPGANATANLRMRRSMSSRIAIEAQQADD
jgi:hypothetical protein